MTEQEYDEQIAPALLELAKKIEALGGSIVARVEWEPDESGSTIALSKDSGIGQKLTALAAQCDGNIDQLFFAAAKRFDMSGSAVWHVVNGPSAQSAG